ncbi:hypothetical protein MTO96_033523 [Rhipicephalus appendiculatus]
MGRNFTIQKDPGPCTGRGARRPRVAAFFQPASRRRCFATSSRRRRQGVYCECLSTGVAGGSHGNVLSLRLVAALGRLCCLPRQEPYIVRGAGGADTSRESAALRRSRRLLVKAHRRGGMMGCRVVLLIEAGSPRLSLSHGHTSMESAPPGCSSLLVPCEDAGLLRGSWLLGTVNELAHGVTSKKPGVQQYDGRRGHTRASTAGARIEPAEIHGPGTVQRAGKFDPFKPPSSVLEDLVQASEDTFMPPRPTAAPDKFQKKPLSSCVGLDDSSETTDDARKRGVNTTMERDQIVAMQGVAGICILAIIIAATLFIGYYVSWSIESSEESTYTPLTAVDAGNESNRVPPIFPSYLKNKKWMQSEAPK